ncbi:MAG TPA: hypothetical protein DCE23_04090 [Firmicutes bacterium]|nr:hypothetical protein [Bacillota bacterium]
MLKIKDNVSYQKLVALGFRKDDFNNCYNYEPDSETIITVYYYDNSKCVTITYVSGYEIKEYDEIEDISIDELKQYMPKLVDLLEKASD